MAEVTTRKTGRHFAKTDAPANPPSPKTTAISGPMQHKEAAIAATTLPTAASFSFFIKSLCAAGKFRRVFEARDGDDFQSFRHRWIDVKHVDEVLYLRAESHSHRCFVNHFSGAVANHRNTQHFFSVI